MKTMMALGIPADQIATMVQKNPAQAAWNAELHAEARETLP